MSNNNRADRLKAAMLEYGTYEEMADKIGISSRTLVRIATGRTEPKFTDVLKISEVTGVDLIWLAYGTEEDIIADGTDNNLADEVAKAHNYVIWNLRYLDAQDIIAVGRQVMALNSMSYHTKQMREAGFVSAKIEDLPGLLSVEKK
ncbi:helix-turn-helix transcriptional regulator [Salmonella enterica subsp. enterica serovar Typhimurium]|nr:helix-turn-helix transcriptional regulator [Salmonella enterica subsp. enterica serovar Typhimurium]EGN0658011.1 helix-turn-helix transcriptional regulator [Salmonella enterica subsp. enterica serovar Typhimurium]